MLTAEQKVARLGGIGGSDAAAVLNLSPYKTPFDLFQEKTGAVEDVDLSDNERVHFGNVLEDVVADEFARRTGLKVRRNNQHLVHPEYEFMLANIDRAVVGKPMGLKCGLECKTTDKWAAKPELWGPGAEFEWNGDQFTVTNYDDQVPDWYLIQSAHYMSVTNSDFWFLAALIGGNDFRIYTIKRDMDLEGELVRREAHFWVNHVQRNLPPPPANVVDLEAMYSIDNGLAIDADDDLIATWAQVKELQAQAKAIDVQLNGSTVGKTKIGGLKNQLRMAIGPHAEILLAPEGKPLAHLEVAKGREDGL